MTSPKGRGVVYIVGAGPGDPSLITLRAVELLERADLVAYDRLVHPDILKLAPTAELVDVGKRPGQSASGQRRINDLLIEEASKGRVVVRLKGGDPFVFGRGGEEAELLAAAGVPFEIVPGVTSAIAGPAYAGIPLTHRDHASWAVIATGHEDPAKESTALDWDAIARAPSAVFLMGIERIDRIATELMRAGKDPGVRATVVASATWPQQRVVHSTLEKVADAVGQAGIVPPAVLIVGSIAALGDRLDWFARRPLAGKRVFVTRTRAQAGRLSGLLRELGAEPVEAPAIAIKAPSSYDHLDQVLAKLEAFEWVIFTSTNSVDAVFDRPAVADARAFAGTRVGAVGPATADALRRRGIVPDLVPETFTSQALPQALGSLTPSGNGAVLVPQAEDAPDDLRAALEQSGWRCEVAAAYRTAIDDRSVEAGHAALDAGVDAILFTSASTVRNFVQMWGMPPEGAVVCCIGPRTFEAAQDCGVNVHATSDDHTIEGLVGVLVATVGR